jgi:transposase
VSPGQCAGCGHDLAGLVGTVAERVQVSDTPPVRLQVTEYQMAEVACPACRTVTRAATPAGLAGPCCYGPDVRAATALLACNGHMSIERAADLMGVLPAAPGRVHRRPARPGRRRPGRVRGHAQAAVADRAGAAPR